MPKTYRCNKIKEDGEVCNETDENNFTEGRYTSCKKCRLKVMSDYNKFKKEEKKDKNTNKIDPDNHVRYLIEDTITRVSLINNMTIPKIIHKLEMDITNECVNLSEKINTFENKILELENENIRLKLQLLKFKEHIQNILNEKL